MFLTDTRDILPPTHHTQDMSSVLGKINLLIILMAVILIILFSLFVICFIILVRLYREHIRQNSHIDCPGCGCHHRDLQTNTKNKDEKIGDSQPHFQQNRLRGQNIWTIQSSEPIYEDIERCKLGLQVSNKSVGKAVSGSDVRSSVIYSVITTKEAAKFRPVADINIIR